MSWKHQNLVKIKAKMWSQLNIIMLMLSLCPALYDSIDCSLPGSSVYGILQARILEWVVISSSRGTSSQPCLRQLLHCQADSPSLSHQGSPYLKPRNSDLKSLGKCGTDWSKRFGPLYFLVISYQTRLTPSNGSGWMCGWNS